MSGRFAYLPILLALQAFSQQTSAPPATFEVASIRANPGPWRSIDVKTSGPRFTADAQNVIQLLCYAYNVRGFQIFFRSRQDEASEDIHYDIQAKAEGDGPRAKDEFRQMLRALLEQRFKLQVHRETREMPVYALVVGKNGPKLQEKETHADQRGNLDVVGRNYVVDWPNSSMENVVQAIANSQLDRPVVDRTGLTGTYHLKLTYTPNTRANREDSDPGDISIFTAVQQLGLRLEARKDQVEVIVIDRVDKPSEN